MRDYNFFSEYVYTESKLRPKKLIVPILLIIVVAGVLGSFFYLEWKLSEKEDLIAEQESFLNSDEVVKTKQELEVLGEEVTYLNLLGEEIELFDLILQLDYRVTEEMTSALLNSVPRNVFFTSYVINERNITISGEAIERVDVAELENNLRDLSMFDNVFVPSVSYNDESEHYVFTIEITLEDFMLEMTQGGEPNDE
ncbi:PilN domain-containing protein [Acidaminobacter sp. JC074]|uniref:PilN domain-containing protein n=1 Tax=Acidaminobacter sp. JC074 TaxID=2530199 RepID=UPI001F10AB01|nr:PilN domain-containing protein [Acidaminobacter sp. JC074]MCH4888553.1 PilN domain-containing protein [Acidaminobacter sp. JC074]